MSNGALLLGSVFIFVMIAAIPYSWIGFVGYSGFVILVPNWNWRWDFPSFEFQKWIAISTVIGFVLTGFRYTKQEKHVSQSLFCFMLYVFLTFLSSIQSQSSQKTDVYWDLTWKMLLMYVIGICVIDQWKKLRWFVIAMVVAQGWNAWGVNQLYLQRGFINVNDFTWNFLDNNTYSLSTIPVLALTIACLLSVDRLSLRLLFGVIFLLQAHQLMILQSRGTMLGAVVLLGLSFAFIKKTRWIVFVFCVGLFSIAILAGPPVVSEFLSSFEKADNLDTSASSRYKLWDAGIRIMLDYPLLGVGPWMGEQYVPFYFDGYNETRSYKALHNLFFEVGTGCGVPAVIAYLGIFWIPWTAHLKLWFIYRDHMDVPLKIVNVATLCGVPGYWIASMFSSGALIETPYLFSSASCIALSLHLNSTNSEMAPEIVEFSDVDPK